MRNEIQGLRAIAVLAVILNHFSEDLLPSGFLGVDIFFVISGYVISASMYDRLARDASGFFVNFYAARVKRLLPALIFCVLITGSAISYVDPAPENSLKTGVAALLGVGNLYLYFLQADYYAASTAFNSFTQTWSLGVEEQFYLVFPAIFFWLHRLGRLKGARILTVFVLVASLASLSSFIYLHQDHPLASFYLLPCRAWELGAGFLAFIFQRRYADAGTSIRRWVTPILCALLLLVLAFPASYVLISTVLAVMLTALIILDTDSRSLARILLSNRFLVFIGTISYSLYLWHWSVLVLSRWTIGVDVYTMPFQLVAVLVVSVFSYKYIERPLREAKWSVRVGRTIHIGLAANLAGCAVLVALMLMPPFSSSAVAAANARPPLFLPMKGVALPFNPTCVVDDDKRPWNPDNFDKCTVPPKYPGLPTIWAMGDSHANHLQGLLYGVHDATGVGVHLVGTPGVPFPLRRSDTLAARGEIYREVARRLRPGDILLISRIFINPKGFEPIDPPGWREDLLALARNLAGQGVHLVVVGPLPIFEFDDITGCRVSFGTRGPCDIDRDRIAGNIDKVHRWFDELRSVEKSIHLFRPFDILCVEGRKQCTPFRDGVAIFWDNNHLNAVGSAGLANDFESFMRKEGLLGSR